ncbi:hypothetical protein FD755_000627 [Muntiacus reevesi]|uniref:Uncharacterized protein n=1 Tax=Muntiacus reevesi TaxID=9886 RepID=A0A5J5MZA6_MUNRE|nr:hypothetical protein FD755_000627 [Muntiacus reevesi]
MMSHTDTSCEREGLCAGILSILSTFSVFSEKGVSPRERGAVSSPEEEMTCEKQRMDEGTVMTASQQGSWNMVPHSYLKGVVVSRTAAWGHMSSRTLQVQEPVTEAPTPSPLPPTPPLVLQGREDFHRDKLLCDPATWRLNGFLAPEFCLCKMVIELETSQYVVSLHPFPTWTDPIGETLRPVWGPMDKCYPVTTQRRRVRSGKKHDSEAMTPKATGGPNDAVPKEETAVLSREEGEVGPLGEEAANLIPGAKGVTEKEEVAGTPGWQENKKARKRTAVYVSEASEVDIVEERPGGWVPQLLRKLWLGWFPASDIPKTQSHE